MKTACLQTTTSISNAYNYVQKIYKKQCDKFNVLG
jgi:hypothetical protein